MSKQREENRREKDMQIQLHCLRKRHKWTEWSTMVGEVDLEVVDAGLDNGSQEALGAIGH